MHIIAYCLHSFMHFDFTYSLYYSVCISVTLILVTLFCCLQCFFADILNEMKLIWFVICSLHILFRLLFISIHVCVGIYATDTYVLDGIRLMKKMCSCSQQIRWLTREYEQQQKVHEQATTVTTKSSTVQLEAHGDQ